MIKTIREVIIMLLVCIVAILAFVVGLYRFIPNKKVIPETVRYVATDEVQDLIADSVETKEKESVVLTYEVTSSDLKGYQNSNTYVPGKTNPFEPHKEDTNTIDGNMVGLNTTTENNSITPKVVETPSVYSNKGTK